MKRSFFGAGLLAGLGLLGCASHGGDGFQEPFRVLANGKPIDVDVGHAAPLMVDFDGDGVKDLMVGQFRQGKLRIYRNIGTAAAPKFGPFAWFRAGNTEGKVPAG